MPNIEFFPADEFTAKTQLIEETPLDNKALSFRVRLPKDWTKTREVKRESFIIPQGFLGELVRFNSPARLEAPSRFSVFAEALPYATNIRRWFAEYALSNGLTLEGYRENGDSSLEAIFLEVVGDTSYIVRLKARIADEKAVVSKFYVPQELWQEERRFQAQSTASFSLSSADAAIVSNLALHTFDDLAGFQYPKDWDLKAGIVRSLNVMKASVLNIRPDKALSGRIDLKLVSVFASDVLENEMEKVSQEFSRLTGLNIGDKIEEREDVTYHESAEFGQVEVFHVTYSAGSGRSAIDYEMWYSVSYAGDYYYFITMLTPGREEDFFTWSRNTEAFKQVVGSAQPLY